MLRVYVVLRYVDDAYPEELSVFSSFKKAQDYVNSHALSFLTDQFRIEPMFVDEDAVS